MSLIADWMTENKKVVNMKGAQSKLFNLRQRLKKLNNKRTDFQELVGQHLKL